MTVGPNWVGLSAVVEVASEAASVTEAEAEAVVVVVVVGADVDVGEVLPGPGDVLDGKESVGAAAPLDGAGSTAGLVVSIFCCCCCEV